MAKKSEQSLFSSIKTRVRENQMTFINVAVTVSLIAIVIIVLLNRASALQRRTAEESLVNQAGMTATEVQAYIISQFDAVRSVSQMLSGFRSMEPGQRRAFFSDTMHTGINSNRPLRDIFSVWRPNALDNLDSYFANTDGNDATGQFMGGFTRQRGWVEPKIYPEYRSVLNLQFVDYFGYSPEIMSPPRSGSIVDPSMSEEYYGNLEARTVDAWVVDIYVPIMGEGTTQQRVNVIGIVGATVNLGQLQTWCESTRPYGTGRIFICSNNGTVVSHPESIYRGSNVLTIDYMNSPFASEILVPLQETVSESIREMKPTVLRTKTDIIVSYPFRTTSTITSFNYNPLNNAPWALVTVVPMSTILATINALIRFSILFIIGAGGLAAFVMFISSRSLAQQSKRLQQNLERATSMQDNLKYGLFLMDDEFVIQGAYSKALEKILSVSGLQGKNFLDLLSSSLKEHERDGFKDYLQMIFKRSFDEQMLESINPVNEFTYLSIETGEKKNLRTTFKLTGGRGNNFILVTMEDVSAEKELQKQLIAAENQMEKEMRSLFEVLQLDPRVLRDFIEDAEFEFTAINEVLKRKELVYREVMFEIFQSVHAVKSNALILNLENFSARLHDLENSIKVIQEKNDEVVPFDDLLELILEIDEALREKDQLKAAISKIENFRKMHGDSGSQEIYVLVETLTQVCKKTQSALDKKVRLVVEGIDEVVLDNGPRRVIKEVLTQLVRNSIYHGIERPSERVPLGKEPEGELRLSIRYRDNQIIIKFTDNGKGIDFEEVRRKAMANKMLRNPSDANDKNQLLKTLFLPGFTTLENPDMHGGRGVGLSLVKDRIKDLLGNITVTTVPGRGTTFTISIPMELPALANS